MINRILIVEDEIPLSKALKLKFEKEGIQSDIAHNGNEAIEALDRDKYNIMLLDILMPGTDGFGVLAYMHEHNITVPSVIVTSNLSQQEDIEKAKKLGATDFLIKSNSSLSDIVERVKQLLG